MNTHERSLCVYVVSDRSCPFGDNCRYSHDVRTFASNRPPDIGDSCPIFALSGRCRYGVTCRFGSQHIGAPPDYTNLVDAERASAFVAKEFEERNSLPSDVLQSLRKRRYNFSLSNTILSSLPKPADTAAADTAPEPASSTVTSTRDVSTTGDSSSSSQQNHTLGAVTDADTIRLRSAEVPKLDLKGKLYLAPLTTLGNLPFRRLCVSLGAEITCSEMALAQKLLQAHNGECALLRRHPSEKLFGVQICGANAEVLAHCAQLLCEQCDLDFVDINCGCPLDLVFRKGEGSALLERGAKLERVSRAVARVCARNGVPLSVKLRTGVCDKRLLAHTLLPRLRDAGVAFATVHGRTKEQHYTRVADWDYIYKCVEAAAPLPVFGNGDVLSFEEYYAHQEQCPRLAGQMLARGALIKPWLFTEIHERRHWDISSSERLGLLKQFVNAGLEHWGSDERGVETTRRFLLEWLSFTYRYIPVGVLERVPQHINERAPLFVGRDELETLMASAAASDWIRISEMLLGPVHNQFTFTPKHRANAFVAPCNLVPTTSPSNSSSSGIATNSESKDPV